MRQTHNLAGVQYSSDAATALRGLYAYLNYRPGGSLCTASLPVGLEADKLEEEVET